VVVAGLLGVRLVVLLGGTEAVAQTAAPPKPAFLRPPPVAEPPSDSADPEQAAAPATPARAEAQSRNNLKQIALAMQNYNDVMGHFPAPAIYEGEKPPGTAGAAASPGGVPMGTTFPGEAPAAGGAAPPPSAGAGKPGMLPTGAAGGMRPPFGAGAKPRAGSDGKALLSWRVALLPFLEQDALYREFHLDEPWDSPHNKKLLANMPQVYAPPGVKTREPYTTFYQVFVGPHAAFEKHRALKVFEFTDGTSNTLLVAEAGSAVPWTKPEDLHFAPDDPLPELGGLFPGVFNAALADGSVKTFSKKADPGLLRAAITRDQGEVVNLDRIKAPLHSRQVELRQQNERLKQELDKERESLEELRREKQLLQQADPESDRLKKENARLEQLLRQTRDDVERLRDEVQRLKQGKDEN
jgi:Protein of unknown function (DUF1559)